MRFVFLWIALSNLSLALLLLWLRGRTLPEGSSVGLGLASGLLGLLLALIGEGIWH